MVGQDSVHAGVDWMAYGVTDGAGSRTVVTVKKADKTEDNEGETHA